MVEQQSLWKVPYTVNVSSFGKTDHGYILIQEAKARSYDNLADTKSIIQRLIDD